MAAAVCAAMVMSCKKDGPAEDPKDDGWRLQSAPQW